MKVLRYKSAKYSIERPLHVGAALAGAGPGLLVNLTDFGLPLGEAFQLRDDLLGVFGDPEVTGKPAGDDLTEGKRTVLVALALTQASEQDASSARPQPGHRPDLGPGCRAAPGHRGLRRCRGRREAHSRADRAVTGRPRRSPRDRRRPGCTPRPGGRRNPARRLTRQPRPLDVSPSGGASDPATPFRHGRPTTPRPGQSRARRIRTPGVVGTGPGAPGTAAPRPDRCRAAATVAHAPGR